MPSRPGSSSSGANNHNHGDTIDRLDYKPGGRPLLRDHSEEPTESERPQSEERSMAGSFFSDVAEGVAEQDRAKMKKEVVRYLSFSWALINTLGAGGITAFSLYGPMFQTRLHYSQLMVNGVSITGMLSLYLPVPIWGVLSDRKGPFVCSLLAGVLFGVGYILAAFTYKSGIPPSRGGDGWPYALMILSFICIGSGTSCMYLSAVVACAKNFAHARYKGLAMAAPIACFGLAGSWQAEVGSHILYESNPDGSKGDVDVHRYFIFLAILLLAVGVIGFWLLKVVDEDELIEEAVEELEQSGLIEENEIFERLVNSRIIGYGTTESSDNRPALRRLETQEAQDLREEAAAEKARRLEMQLKKTWLLNEETRRFLTDSTMWFLWAGFLLVSGPGEAFVNNLGTVIPTLYSPPEQLTGDGGKPQTSVATQVTITAITSTIARLLTGSVADLVAPDTVPHQHRRGPNSMANSMASLPSTHDQPRRWEISRIQILIAFSIAMSIGQSILASGVLQGHGDRFFIVSTLIGLGYGSVFSLTPIVVSVIWGVENFGTNWGVVAIAPAFGATLYGLLYSGVYQSAANKETPPGEPPGEDVLCYGASCYSATFWVMAASVWIACGLWFCAWRGPNGWYRRSIAV